MQAGLRLADGMHLLLDGAATVDHAGPNCVLPWMPMHTTHRPLGYESGRRRHGQASQAQIPSEIPDICQSLE